jgi:hypothetical protein
MLSFHDLPYELQSKIFRYVEPVDFSNVCRVSKYWNAAMNDSTTWMGRLKDKNIYCEPDILHHILFDRREMINYYLLHGKTNLLKNINFDDGVAKDLSGSENFVPSYEHWDEFIGDWRIERHIGCDPYPAETNIAAYNTVTTYFSCSRRQKIDLSKWYPNIENLIQSGFKVRLYWHVWIAARYDCKSMYRAYIMYDDLHEDLVHNDEVNSDKILLGKKDLPAGREWVRLSSTLDLDPSKGSSFSYYDAGQDGQYWRGHYGVKVLNPTICVRIIRNS